jgi:hypothetical protein
VIKVGDDSLDLGDDGVEAVLNVVGGVAQHGVASGNEYVLPGAVVLEGGLVWWVAQPSTSMISLRLASRRSAT